MAQSPRRVPLEAGASVRFLHVIEVLVETAVASDEAHSRSVVGSVIDEGSVEVPHWFCRVCYQVACWCVGERC